MWKRTRRETRRREARAGPSLADACTGCTWRSEHEIVGTSFGGAAGRCCFDLNCMTMVRWMGYEARDVFEVRQHGLRHGYGTKHREKSTHISAESGENG